MNKDKQKLLFEKYPRFFSFFINMGDKYPFQTGISCGDGWFDLIDRTIAEIEILYQKLEPKITKCPFDCGGAKKHSSCWQCGGSGEIEVTAVIDLIKEKFGGLRIYITSGTEEMFSLLDEAEKESNTICEDCGQPGFKGRRSPCWIATLCAEHQHKEI